MKLSLNIVACIYLSLCAALPAVAMNQDCGFCSLDGAVLQLIASSADWKSIGATQRTCRYLRDNFQAPTTKPILIDFSHKREKYEYWDQFYEHVLTRLRKLAFYNHNNPIILDLSRNLGGNNAISSARALDEFIKSLCELGLAGRVIELNLASCDLYEIPKAISQFRNLERLDLSRNGLHNEAVEMVCNIPSLVQLSLDGNYISQLPDRICNLTNLEQLRLGYNVLSAWQLVKLGSLAQKLKLLSLRNNRLETMPEVIGHLKNLVSLDLGNNYIPAGEFSTLSSLQQLVELHLDNTRIHEVPDVLSLLPHLTFLDLSANDLPESELQKIVAIKNSKSKEIRARAWFIIPALL